VIAPAPTAAITTRPASRFDARWLGEVLALATLYFLTARLGLLMAMPSGHVTPVWPPSGIALAAVLLRGRRVWPGIWLGSFAANIWDFYGGPPSLTMEVATAATFGIGASLTALLGRHLLRRFVGQRNPLERVLDVCAFMALGGVVSCLVSATVGVSMMCLGGFAPWSAYGETWLTWWLGDAGGVFIVAPLLLVWGGTHQRKLAARWVELFGGFGLMIAITYYVFCENTIVAFTGKPLTFIILIPFLVWAAVRFGRRGAAAAVGLIASLAVWGTTHDAGPFNLGPRNEALLLLELFLGVMALTALCLAAMVTEHEHIAAARQRAVEELESHVRGRTSALVESEAEARQHLAQAERARAALLSILEDQQKTEEKLRESEARFRELAENIDEVFWIWTATPGNPRLLYVSPAYATIWGRTCESLYGSPQSWKEALHPDDKEKVLMEIAHLDFKKMSDLTYRIVRPDQSIRWIRDRIFPVRDRSGEVVRFAGVAEDITESKAIAKALESAEEQYRSIFNNALNGIFRTSPDGKLLVANPAAARIFGYGSPDESIDASWDIAHQAYVDPLRREELKRLLQEHGVVNGFEFEAYRKDGSRVWISENTRAVHSPSGELLYFEGFFEDVTDRKRAEEKLWHSLNLLRAITEGTTDAIYAKDREGRYLMINTAGARFEGKTPEEIIGRDDTYLFSGETLARILERDDAIMKTGETRTDEDTATTAEGLDRVHLTTKGPLRDSTGEITGLFGVSRDITERKREEEKLRESEARFRRLLASNIIGVIFWTLEGDIYEANDLFLNMVGYTREDLRQGNLNWRNLTPREYVHLDEKAIEELVATGTCAGFEKEYIRKDGSQVSVLVGAALLDAQKQTGSSFVMDISERKQAEDRLRRSEEKFKTLFGIAPVGIAFLDSRLNIVDCNPALERLSRLSRQELLGKAWRQRTFVNADGSPRLPGQRVSERAVSQKRFVNGVETGAVMESGDIVWAEVSVAPLALPDARAVVIMQDITERKRAAEELRKANHQLRILSRQLFHIQEEERRHLARELHDEIGQTLTAAKINLKIVAPDVPAKVSGRLDDSIQLLDRLLRQVRELSLDLRPPLLDELGLVPTLRWLMDQQGQRARLRVTFATNVDGVEIDPDVQTACFRVAQEGITNIIRHSGAKSIAVELRRETERLWLSVRDDGTGFDPSGIQNGVPQHSSLGLVSMKERALLVRGGFEVKSAPGQGTEIRAWFPLARGSPLSPETV
jgi:PAS domain S-box-containing protein